MVLKVGTKMAIQWHRRCLSVIEKSSGRRGCYLGAVILVASSGGSVLEILKGIVIVETRELATLKDRLQCLLASYAMSWNYQYG